MPKKHILEFSTYAKIGGTQKMLLEFLRHASHDQYEYFVCVLLEHDVLNEEVSRLGLTNISLQMRGYWDLAAWWKLYHFAKAKQIDLMRTYGLKADIIGRLVGKLLGIPVHITSVRSTDPWRKWYHVFLDACTAGFSDLYLSNSEAGRRAVQRRERIPRAKIATIPNGIDLTTFAPGAAKAPGAFALNRQTFGIAPDAPVLGIVANLCKMKGHKTIVDALPRIQAQFPQVKCLFVGTDFLHGAIQAYVQARRLENAVIFTGFRRDIPEMLALFDLFLLPSDWEGSPTALLEALAMQKPVIAAEVGGIPEIITAGRTGLLIPPQNPDALADAVLFLLRNPETAAQIGQAGYEHVRQHFSIESVVAQTEAIYAQLIARKAWPRRSQNVKAQHV